MTIENDGAVAPETVTSTATDAPAVTETPAVSEVTETPEDPSATPKKDRGVGKRINELVREREEAKREREYWRQQALEAKTPKAPEQVDEQEPQEKDFDSYGTYLKALARYELKQELKVEREQTEKKQRETSERERLTKSLSEFDQRANKLREKHDDFDDVAFGYFPVTPAMSEAILESDLGPDIMYYLGNNPKEASRIAQLGPFAAAREIGRLEVKLPELTQASAAPAPITPVKPKSAASEAPSESDDMKTWIAKRRKQVRSR